MSYEFNFGNLSVAKSAAPAPKTRTFRIAVLGDFSGRANRGELEVGEALAARKPLKVDCDNVDETIERLGLKINLPIGDGALEIEVTNLDDLHPDQLFGKLPIFSELAALRKQLKTTSTFAKAAKEIQAWAGEVAPESAGSRGAARGLSVPADGKLSDFAQLIGRPSAPAEEASPVEGLLRQAVAPYIVPSKDPRQDVLVAALDQALTAMMREILHHPDFQAMEALWRSVDFLVRRLETDTKLQIVLLDISAEELAADISREDGLESSGLYQLLVEQPVQDAHQGPYSLIIGNYIFDHTPPHAEVLGRLAKIAAQAQAPFVAAIAPGCMDVKPQDIHPLVQEAWSALKAMPESAYAGLTLPRFMLRLPYGKKTEPIDSFDFEEFAPHIGLRGMLWGNSAILAAALLGASFSKDGVKMSARAMLGLDELPFYYYTDKDGDQVALPCTERLISSRVATALQGMGFIPILAIKGSPEIRVGGFRSLAGKDLAGWWAPATPAAPAPEEEPAADAASAEEPAPDAGEAPAEDSASLDDLLAGIGTDEAPAAGGEAPAAPEGEAPVDSGTAELDALLAGMTSEEPAAKEGEVASDLEKLLGDLG